MRITSFVPTTRALSGVVAEVLLAGAAPGGVAAASDPPACGRHVTHDVRLRADLACAGDGLIIDADGVTVDLAGHRLTGSGSGSGITVAAHSQVGVRRGTIAGFGDGVALLAGATSPAGIRL